MKAILLAAGEGSRMGKLTQNIPKPLVKVNGKSIIERQLSILKQNKILDVIIVTGSHNEKFNFKNVVYVNDLDHKKHDTLGSLMTARDYMNDEIITTYADQIFEEKIVKSMTEFTGDIGIAVDLDWEKNYENRTQHPKPEADLALIKSNKLTKIKKNLDYVENYQLGEFLGIVKLSDNGCKLLLKSYDEIRNDDNGGFHDAESSTKAYLTDMIQELIDSKIEVKPIFISGKWCEIDTIEDLKSAKDMF